VSRGKRDAADCLNISMIVRMEAGSAGWMKRIGDFI